MLKKRFIVRPCGELKVIQREIHRLLTTHFEAHPIAHAYAKGRSIVTNASAHVRKEWLLHVDLVDFFGSISEKMVVAALRDALPDFNVSEVEALARLCCHRGFLPQGSSASPIISNIVCFALDQNLEALGRGLGVTVTRYSDDICFSSTDATLPIELATVWGCRSNRQVALGKPLARLFEMHGFRVNAKKVRFQDRSERQQVTGVIVNEGLNVPRAYYMKVRGSLRLWGKHGAEVAARHFRDNVSVEAYVRSLRGLIAYIGQVTGAADQRYRQLLNTFARLEARDRLFFTSEGSLLPALHNR